MKPPVTKTTAPAIRSTADFARYVGLSRSAVSRVLNDQPGLRPETVARVRQAMEDTGFTVNVHARHLRGQPTAMIGVCIEDLLTPTAVSKLSGLQEVLRARNYTALIEVLKPGASRQVLRHFFALRVDAVVFIGHFDAAELERSIATLTQRHLPHLVVDHPGIKRANTVTLDRVRAMAEVTAHLLALGHRRFGLLGIAGPFQTVADRLRGVSEALVRAGLDPAQCMQSLDLPNTTGDHFDYGGQLARSFAQIADRPTAFLAVNDETAVGAILEFQALGLRVPEDVSVVGFNNQKICRMTRPQLSSVDQQIDKSMVLAADIILQQIGRPSARRPSLHKIAPVFVVRGSTGPVPPATHRGGVKAARGKTKIPRA